MIIQVIIFMLGLLIGSFLNVVIHRSNTGETVTKGRSHCPLCGNVLCWYELIPIVSFLLQRGRCNSCKNKISLQYPIVEVFTSIVFFAGWRFYLSNLSKQIFQNPILFWCYTLLVLFWIATLVAIFVYDWKYLEIPTNFLRWGILFSVASVIARDADLLFISNNFSVVNSAILSGIAGALMAGGFFFLLVAVSREKWMGRGDIYIGAIIGMVVGWPWILEALMIAFTVGAVVGIFLMLLKGKDLKTKIAFGPFLVFGGLITLFWGQRLFNLYLAIF